MAINGKILNFWQIFLTQFAFLTNEKWHLWQQSPLEPSHYSFQSSWLLAMFEAAFAPCSVMVVVQIPAYRM